MKCALDNNILDGVVSVKEGDNLWEPIPTLSKSKEDLIKAIGTYYAYASTIQLVKKGDTN
jgi:coenzyme F420-reducing hydrogenase beta subunit